MAKGKKKEVIEEALNISNEIQTETKKVSISFLKENPKNPRKIKKENFERLVKSIKDFPDMLQARPIVVDENFIVLGGNMRYKACKELGIDEVPIIQIKGLTEEQKGEFLIKDNKNFGDWDWEILADEWDFEQLNDWGFGEWQKPKKVEDEDTFRSVFDETKNEDALMPIIPKFDEKYEMFIIVSDSEIDSNWLREKLCMQKMKGYKRGNIMKSNIIDVKDLLDVL